MTACNEAEATEFSILLIDEDQVTVLYNEMVSSGAKIEGIATPTKEADAEYTYTFAGWVDENGNRYIPTTATKDVVAYASYTATAREYSLTVISNEQEIYSYEKVKVLRSGTYLTTGSVVYYGDELSIEVIGSSGYSHDDKDVSYQGLEMTSNDGDVYFVVRGDVTISFTETAELYTVKFLDSDGTQLWSTTAAYGSSVVYPYDVPTKATDLRASYIFEDWVDSDGNYVSTNRIVGNTTCYAYYTETYIAYYLTIESGANIKVYKNGTQIYSGAEIHYGDTLVIETDPTEGYYVSSLQVNSVEVSINSGSTSVVVNENGVSITYEETIYTFSVVLCDESGENILYSDTVEYGKSITTDLTQTKETDVKYTYSFEGWVNALGTLVSLENIKSSITAYAYFEATLVPYTISVSNYLTIMLEGGTTINSETATNYNVYYDEIITISSYNLPSGYSYNYLLTENLTQSSTETYVVTGDVSLTLFIEKSYIAYIYEDNKKFVGWVDDGNSSAVIVEEFDYNSYTSGGYAITEYYEDTSLGFAMGTYVGTTTNNLSASYDIFVVYEALNFTSYKENVISHTATYNSSTLKWTGTSGSTSGIYYTDYLKTPLYQGMIVEFTWKTVSADLFGLSTSAQLADPANNVWSKTSDSFDRLFTPLYNMYVESSGTTRYLHANETKGFDDLSTYISAWSASVTYTIRLVLGTYLEIYITNNSTGVTENLNEFTTDNWYLTAGTAYYLTFLTTSASSYSQITTIEYDTTFESLYLSYLSEKTISLLGDSITYGTGATDSNGDQHTTEANANRYSSLLATSLGMEEDNLGIGGTMYCTGGVNSSRIYDIEDMDANAEIAVIMLGTNDFDYATSSWATLGEFGSTDTTTIYGALNVMYESFSNYYSNDTVLYVCTAIPTQTDLSYTTGTYKKNGEWTLAELAEAIKEVAEYYGIGVIDLYNEVEWDTSYFKDNLHPNNDGHAVIAEYMYNQILEDNMYDYAINLCRNSKASATS